MIVTEFAYIKISPNNYKYFDNLGYKNLKIKDIIKIKVDELIKGSTYKIDVKCDICGRDRQIEYRMYLKSLETGNYYTCSKCIYTKRETPFSEEAMEKARQTKIEKYGDPHYNNHKKCKETKIERYGDEKYNNSEQNKITCLQKYGDENYCNKDKIKETKLKIYGDENYNNRDKMKETCLEKYGDEHYRNKEKYIETMLERYGVNHPMKCDNILNKAKETKIKNGYSFKPCTEWYLYKRKVKCITNSFKKELFEKWDGSDYYDNTYIKDNVDYKSSNYRSIDHKISIFYGFKNNIPAEIIGNIDNLCLTKQITNSTKQKKSESEFKI